MNEIIKVEEGTLIVAQKAIEQIKDFERKRKLIEQKEKKFKEQLIEVMQEYGIKSYESPDKSLQITLVPETVSTTFDSKALWKDDFETYQKYLKDTTRKASVRMTIRGEE